MGKYAEVADHLTLVGQLRSLDDESNSFQVGAYDKAARTFRDLDYLETTGQEVPDWHTLKGSGIGSSLRGTIQEYLDTGTSTKYQELARWLPVECLSMTVVQGIGPKKAYGLWLQGTHNFGELVAKAYAGELDKGLRAKVLQAAQQQNRVPYLVAKGMADSVLKQVLQVPGVLHATICGSIRRHAPTSKDIDIAVCLDPEALRSRVMEDFSHLGTDFQGGEKKCSMLVSGQQCDLRCDLWLGEPSYYGSLRNHCTGSKDHNVALRTLAASRGMTISEYGIFDQDGIKLGGEDEHDIYRVLGIPYVEPEQRNK